ncbi:MAG: response regulator [Cyanobium sp.]
MDPIGSPFQISTTILVIGEAAYRNARMKVQRALTALDVRETERAQVVAEFSIIYRNLIVGNKIGLNLIGDGRQLDLSLQIQTEAGAAAPLLAHLRVFSLESQQHGDGSEETIRMHHLLRTTGAMDVESAREWLLGITTEELRHRAEQTEEANAAKREFLSRMSHELRTPMNAIIGMTHLALRTELNQRQRDYLEKIQSAGKNLLGIINDVLDFSKIEAGKLNLENTDFILDQILGDVTNLVAERVVSKGVELLFSVDEDVPDSLNGDPLRLTQVLLNLLSNAAKFTERGQITLHVSVVTSHGDDVELQFEVKDTGIGMSESQMANLFQAFSQADVSTTRRYGGTGLGLSICQRILELMGGTITVSSHPGQGSCFRATARFARGQKEARQVMPLGLNQLRVLVVDDNPAARDVMVGLLAHLPVEQLTASTGEQALQMVEAAARDEAPFGLILLDWQLGEGMDGSEVARRIHAKGQPGRPRIVLITAHGDASTEAQDRFEHVDACLRKPVRASELIDTLVGLFIGTDADQNAERGSSQSSGASAGAAWNLEGVKVLLVEDNLINQQIACELLTIVGVEVETAQNGKEALTWLEAHTDPPLSLPTAAQKKSGATRPCDLVLMDLNMPEMDGWECIRRIRSDERWEQLPVLAMTAHAMQQERDRCLALGMQDHITKPIDPDHLYERLRHWCGRVASNPPTPTMQQPGEPESQPPDGFNPAVLKGFDMEQALRRVAGNTSLYGRLLLSLLQNHGDALVQLDRALGQKDDRESQSIVHSVKGVAANLGATALAEAAGALEAKLKQGSCPAPLKQRFAEALELTMQELRQAFGDAHPRPSITATIDATQEPLNPEQQSLLKTLEHYLSTSDGEAVELIEIQKDMLTSILGSETYNRLQQQVDCFSFTTALALLQAQPQQNRPLTT